MFQSCFFPAQLLDEKINSQDAVVSTDPETSLIKTSRVEIIDVHRENGKNIFEVLSKFEKDLYDKNAMGIDTFYEHLKEKLDYDYDYFRLGQTLGQTRVAVSSGALSLRPLHYFVPLCRFVYFSFFLVFLTKF